MWNKLVYIKNNSKNEDVKLRAGMYLRQLNTAGGKELIGEEVEFWLLENECELITTKIE